MAENASSEWTQKRVAESIVNRHAATAAAAGLIPVPIIDVAGISAIALNMLNRLSEVYEVQFSREAALNVIATLTAGVTPLALRATAIGVLKAIPLIGTFAGTISMPILGGSVVYAVGQVMIAHYESGGDLLNFNARQAKAYFKENLGYGRVMAKAAMENKSVAPTAG